jgi:hypothetical protein
MADQVEPLSDANIAPGSSPEADAAAANAAQEKAPVPSTEAGEPQTDAQRDAAILERVEANQGERSEPPTDEAGKPPVKPGDKEEPDPAKPAEKTAEQQAAEDAKLPFHKHPRWMAREEELKAAKAENDSLKASTKAWQESVEWMQQRGISPQEHQGALESYAEARQANVSPQDIAETMKWRAMVNTNPIAAIQYAKQWMGQLEVYAGQVLPKDLQDAVTAGEMTENWAKKLADQRLEAERAKGTLDSHTQLTQQGQVELVKSTVDSWVTAKFLQDPELKASASDPNGLFADIQRRMNHEEGIAFAKNKRPLTPSEASALLEKCYNEAKGYTAKFTPRAPARKTPLRTGSSPIRELPENPTDEQLDENILNSVASRHGGGF